MDSLHFPDDDPDQFSWDCEAMRTIVLSHLNVHCAMLRAAGRATGKHGELRTPVARAGLIEDLVQYGLAGAAEKGLATSAELRALARTPEHLVALRRGVIEQGDPAIWWPADTGTSEPPTVRGRVREFAAALAGSHKDPAGSTSGPYLVVTDIINKLPFVPLRFDDHFIWVAEFPVVHEVTATLRLKQRNWGKLRADRDEANCISITARTGVFLANPIGSKQRVRAAAAIPKSPGPVTEFRVELAATQSGLTVNLLSPVRTE